MPSGLTLAIIVIAIVVGTVLVSEAVARLMRVIRGIDEHTVNRRLTEAGDQTRASRPELFQQPKEAQKLQDVFVPFYRAIARYIAQSGASITVTGVVVLVVFFSVAFVLLLLLALPKAIDFLAIPCGVLAGGGLVVFYMAQLRAKRIAAFEEQLPDAIELIVRSLRVGHPLSVALSAVAGEMPSPIGPEFATANTKVTYGLTIPEAFKEMHERVPLPDLGFLIVAFQIQSESGGNLVESLAKLANVIRDRFRMFRKVKSMTAEGRLSAWLLSIFPGAIGLAISVVRPGYYDNISQVPYFSVIAVVTVLFLILNVVVMVIITKMRV